MVSIIYGTKGSGKTKQIIDSANASLQNAKGNIVYITDTKEHSLQIENSIRYINAKEYLINTQDRLIGLLAGLMAGNADIEQIFVDGPARICSCPIADMEAFYNYLQKLCQEYGMRFTVTVSAAKEDLPGFIQKLL